MGMKWTGEFCADAVRIVLMSGLCVSRWLTIWVSACRRRTNGSPRIEMLMWCQIGICELPSNEYTPASIVGACKLNRIRLGFVKL